MNLTQQFQDYIRSQKLFVQSDRLLLAVSGGVDSVVLCELCRQAGFDFSIAHCNFKLRAEESDADEIFVQALAQHYQVPFFVKKFDTHDYCEANNLGTQEAARILRYDWFKELLAQMKQGTNKACWLLTAHHADDNTETILMNFFKGAGIAGLKGILPKAGVIVRPLLFAKKETLLSFAHSQGLAFREDASNATDHYTRNFFRHNIIPLLQNIYPQATENLQANASRFRDIQVIYDEAIKKTTEKLVVKQKGTVHIPVLKLLNTGAWRTVLWEILKPCHFSAQQAEAAAKLVDSDSGKFVQSATHRLLRNRRWLILSPLQDAQDEIIVIEEAAQEIHFAGGSISMLAKSAPPPINPDASLACLDRRAIQFPLLLRKWKKGDYFYPLGMKKKKKLSRFFIDQKLSLAQKENIWVIESNKQILWVVGHRIDDRYKLRPSTTHCLLFQCSGAK